MTFKIIEITWNEKGQIIKAVAKNAVGEIDAAITVELLDLEIKYTIGQEVNLK